MPLPTVADLIKINEDALTVLNGSLQTLKASLAGQDPDEKARILARMGRINNEIQVTQNVVIHLHAADVVVNEMSNKTIERLDALAGRLDNAIISQAWINASLAIIQGLFDTASSIRKITEMNSSA